MREGVHRDGTHLYPAFPYPSFAKTSDADLQALYAFLMAQPAVRQANAGTKLAFPFNIRPLMAGWNLLFIRPGTIVPDPSRSALWNRGRYLVDGLPFAMRLAAHAALLRLRVASGGVATGCLDEEG